MELSDRKMGINALKNGHKKNEILLKKVLTGKGKSDSTLKQASK